MRRHIFVLREIYENPDTEYSIKAIYDTGCIFFHIPKTGGTSVAKALYGNKGVGHITYNHAEWIFGRRFLREALKFTIVRNPWDRFLSAYLYLRGQDPQESDTPYIVRLVQRFENFNEFALALPDPRIMKDVHFRPQLDFIIRRDGAVAVDSVGYFEELDSYVRGPFAERIGRSCVLPHLNGNQRANKAHWSEWYSEEACEAVARAYAVDLRVLPYRFGQAQQSSARVSCSMGPAS